MIAAVRLSAAMTSGASPAGPARRAGYFLGAIAESSMIQGHAAIVFTLLSAFLITVIFIIISFESRK
jgi:hypothetical protein